MSEPMRLFRRPNVFELRDHLRQWDADDYSAADRVCARRARNDRECRGDACAQYGDECDRSACSNLASRQRYLWEQHDSPLRYSADLEYECWEHKSADE